MHKGSLILLSIIEAMAHYDDTSLDEVFNYALNYTEDMDIVKGNLYMEALRLQSEGHTEEEVLNMIDSLSVKDIENLSAEEKQVVRDDTKKLILKRKENLNYE